MISSIQILDLITIIDQLCIILDRLPAIFYFRHDLDIICLIFIQLALSILRQCHALCVFT